MPTTLRLDARPGPAPLRRLLAQASRFRRDQPARALLYALAVASFLFMAAPGLDLSISRLFIDGAGRFWLAGEPALVALRDFNRMQPALAAAILLAVLLVHALRPERRCPVPPHRAVFALGVQIVSGGVLVHLLKNAMGRARPHAIAEFGGEAAFSAAWQIAGACRRNCSFSSGEAASAAATLALLALLPPPLRPAGLAVLGPFVLAASLNRVASGSHFLSDVVVSWLIVALVALFLGRLCRAHAGRIDAAVRGSAGRLPALRVAARRWPGARRFPRAAAPL